MKRGPSAVEAVERYRKAFRSTWTDETPLGEVRFVALDCELTGLDPKKAHIVSIGGVAVRGREILLRDAFEELVRIPFNTASVTVHGVTAEQSQAGRSIDEALEDLLDYLGDAVVVGHHIDFDRIALDQALGHFFDIGLENLTLDTMRLSLGLDPGEREDFSLDVLLERYGIDPHDRHTAAGDAYLTAEVFVRLLMEAARSGVETLGGLRALAAEGQHDDAD